MSGTKQLSLFDNDNDESARDYKRPTAMTGCFCPTCKEYVFYIMRDGTDVFYNNVGPPWLRHICEDDITPPKQITDRTQKALSYNVRGVDKAERGNNVEAISDYNIAIRLDPINALLYFNRGLAKAKLHYNSLGNYNRAIGELGINPMYVSHIQSEAAAAIASAIRDFDTAIRLSPDFARAYLNRGILKTELAPDHNSSDSLLHRTIFSLLDEYDSILREVDVSNSRLAAYTGAIADYNKALCLEPNYTKAYIYRGQAKHELRQYIDAISDYDIAIHLNSDDAEAYFCRAKAKVFLRGDQYAAAIADYDKAIYLKPDYVAAYVCRAHAHEMCRQYEAAISDYDVILRSYPKSTLFYLKRAQAKSALKQIEMAEQDCYIALKLATKKDDVKMKKRIQRQLNQLTNINKKK